MSIQREDTLLFVGYARLPANIVSGSGSDVLSLELEVDPRTDVIVNAACSGIPSLGVRLILGVLIGYDLKHPLSGLEDEIRRRFFGPAQKAVTSALERAYAGYLGYKNSILQGEKIDKSLQD